MRTPDCQPASIEAAAPPPIFGHVLRRLREERELTIAEFAEATDYSAVMQENLEMDADAWQQSVGYFSIAWLVRIAEALALTTAERIALIESVGFRVNASATEETSA